MEAVIGNEGEKDEEIIANVIKFSQLKTLSLSELPRLISFFPWIKKATTTENHSFPPAQSLFNEKVAFPALEELYIDSLQNITKIWDKNLLPAESSCQLRSLDVIPSRMLFLLKKIKTLKVSKCPEMEVIVSLEKREEETQETTTIKDMIIVFPELTDMTLTNLEKLKGVCTNKSKDQLCFNVQFPRLQKLSLMDLERLLSFNNTCTITETRSLFNHQVAFPSLEELYINSLQNITEIWDKNLLPAESFCQLRSLNVRFCEKLMNVIPSHMLFLLKKIKTLEVSRCPEMEVIVSLEKREDETRETTTIKDMIIVFPKLTDMTLRNLGKLKGVCAHKSEDQLCFNVQVAFPSLEDLSISSMHNITEIWDNNLLLPKSFCLLGSLGVWSYEKLRFLEVRDCKKLKNVVPSHMFPLLKNLERLIVSKCPKMEVIAVFEKREEETQETSNKDIIVFPELTSLMLRKLKNLKGVCAYKSEDRLCFNVQVEFPKLITAHLDYHLDKHTKKIFTEATSRKKECATMDASGSGMQLQQ